MKRIITILAASFFCLSACGCSPNAGWLVRPVPVDQRLLETVIARDRGWAVRDKVVVVDVDGLLMNQRQMSPLLMPDNPVSLFVEKLDRAQADPHVRAVVLRINSPGGGVTASDIMYRRLVEFRAVTGVPVIAVLEDVGASGGYYLACGADTILAHPTTVTGSIGVIVHAVSIAGTMDKLGVAVQAVTSGPRKDMASPLKPLDAGDVAILQGVVDEYYRRFLDVVAAGRPKLTAEQIRALADGRVFTGQQALAAGLVDGLAYVHEAVALAKEASGSERVQVVIYHRPLGFRANVYSSHQGEQPQMNPMDVGLGDVLRWTQPQFLYLWSGRGH